MFQFHNPPVAVLATLSRCGRLSSLIAARCQNFCLLPPALLSWSWSRPARPRPIFIMGGLQRRALHGRLTVYTCYDEVRPVNTPELRAVTIALIVTGCTGMIFLTGTLIQLITASQPQQFFGSRRMQKEIEHLTDHVIICGYGRIGQMLARELQAKGRLRDRRARRRPHDRRAGLGFPQLCMTVATMRTSAAGPRDAGAAEDILIGGVAIMRPTSSSRSAPAA